MGKIHFQTREQQTIFSEVAKYDYFRQHFYFTGGTALSSFYLHHRYSDDLDFFSEKQFSNEEVLRFIEKKSKEFQFTFQARSVEVVYIFNLFFGKKSQLKVDFAYYPHKRVEKGNIIEGLEVDSLIDIAINKIFVISQRGNVKDFVDLYFLLQDFSVWDLMYGAAQKFNAEIDPMLLAADFLKVEDFTFLPKMIKPLSLEELQEFFRKRAQDLGRQSFR